jgi:peptidoglycan/LPS O-acetylase OafA/YrhL
MTGRLHRLSLRRRAMALLLFGVAYTAYGVRMAYDPPDAARHLGPVWLPIVAFIVGGLLTVHSAASRRTEWWGFTALYTLSGLWALHYVPEAFTADDTARAVAGLVHWTYVTVVVLLIAGWAEPPPQGRAGSVKSEQQQVHLEEQQRRADDGEG